MPNHAIGVFHDAVDKAGTIEIKDKGGAVYRLDTEARTLRIDDGLEWSGTYTGNLSIKASPIEEEDHHDQAKLEITLDSVWQKIQAESIALRLNETGYRIENGVLDLSPFEGKAVKESIALFNEASRHAEKTTVEADGRTYWRDNETGAIVIDNHEKGLGVLSVKAKLTKSKGKELAKVDLLLGPLWEKDTETIAYSSDAATNERLIKEFLARWVHEPLRIMGVKTGCEINFNRIFPKQSDIRPSQEILADIARIDAQLARLEAEMAADIRLGG